MQDEYVDLRKKVLDVGLLKKSEWWYIKATLLLLALFALGTTLLIIHDYWALQIALAFFLSFLAVQFGFIGHDAAHKSISDKKFWNNLLGHIGMTIIGGVSLTHWQHKHDKHHANSNIDGLDPEMDRVLSFTEEKAKQKKGIMKFIAKHQILFFIPVHAFVALGLRYLSITYLRNLKGWHKIIEALLLSLHYAIWIILPLIFIGPIKTLVLYLISSLLTGLYFSFVFVPNHTGMPSPKERLSFFMQQVITSRNIKGKWLTTVIFGGLNYQIEHHLFPTMSRKNLKACSKIVKEFCEKHKIKYEEVGVFKCYKDVLSHVNKISKTIA